MQLAQELAPDVILLDIVMPQLNGIDAAREIVRRNPEARWRLSEDDIPRLAREQLGIARRAMSLVAPGGRLVYATCTVLRQENEAVVEQLLAPGWEVMRVAEIWGSERAAPVTDPSGTYLKLRPDRHDTDGFFAAILYRRAG